MMTDKDMSKIKIAVMAEMTEAFYVDFMPFLRDVQKDVSELKLAKENAVVINRINENLSKAVVLLTTLKNITDKEGEHND